MNAENIELTVFAVALLLTTINIYIYSWFENNEKYLRTGLWVIRFTSALPGLGILVWAIYSKITDPESTLGMALFTAGMFLTAAAIQFLSQLQRKLNRSH